MEKIGIICFISVIIGIVMMAGGLMLIEERKYELLGGITTCAGLAIFGLSALIGVWISISPELTEKKAQ